MAVGQYCIIFVVLVAHDVCCYGSSYTSGVTTFGSNDKQPNDDYLPPGNVFLISRIPTAGILYKVEPYFTSTDPVFIQLWYLANRTTNSYKLVFQKEVKSDVANATKAILFSTDYDNSCPLVNEDMFLGVWSPPDKHLSIGVYYQDFSTDSPLYESYLSPNEKPYLSETRSFYESSYPSMPDLKGYVYTEDDTYRRSKRTPTAPCPSDGMPEPEPEETTTARAATATTTTEPRPEPEISPTVSDHVTRNSGMEPDTETSNSRQINTTVIYIISGAAAAVLLILVLVVTCCVVKRRRAAPPTVTISPPTPGDGKHPDKSHHKQISDDDVHYQRRNLDYVPDRAAYERPLPGYQGRGHEYASMEPAPPGGVYEEIPDGDPKKELSNRRRVGDTGQRSDGAYLQPGEQQYVSAGSYLHTTEPQSPAYLQVKGAGKQGSKVKDEASRGDQSPYLELEIDQNGGKYGHHAKR